MSASLSQIDVDDLLKCIVTTKDFKSRVLSCIVSKLVSQLSGIKIISKYNDEYILISSDNPDSPYNNVLILAEEEIVKERILTKIKNLPLLLDNCITIIIGRQVAFVKYDKNFIIRGPYELNKQTIIRIIEIIRGLSKKRLEAKILLKDFGSKTNLTRKAVNALYKKLIDGDEKTRSIFNSWIVLFKQISGYRTEKLEELLKEYDIEKEKLNIYALLFAIQTYYALIIKLIAAEALSSSNYRSYIAELIDTYMKGIKEFKDKLEELESGELFRKFGIINFLDGDYFFWYLNKLDEELAEIIFEIAKTLDSYALQLEPAGDFLKYIYRNLIPKAVRHKLGEYYTSDWLADLLLDEIGLSIEKLEELGKEDLEKPLRIRVLDPACGSGTFLTKYISRIKAYANAHNLDNVLLNYLLENVIGNDLNPIAVIAARTNYLLTIIDLPRNKPIQIPVYLTDSLIVPNENLSKFDFVIGNPPWVNWESLPEDYRKTTKQLWKEYGLTEVKGKGLGKTKRDLSMLFTTVCFHKFLKQGGKLGFLIPLTVFKTQAGRGFRNFLISFTKIDVIHDLSRLNPFEDAINSTAMIIIEKSREFNKEVKNIVWKAKTNIKEDMSLNDVINFTERFTMIMIPIDPNDKASPWMQVTPNALSVMRKIIGKSEYRAYEGVNTALNQVYFVKILGETDDGIIITNPSEKRHKKRVKQVKAIVESHLVYPLVRGKNVKKWHISDELDYIILPIDKDGRILSHEELKDTKALEYFRNFFNELVRRNGEPYKSTLKAYRDLPFEKAEKVSPPFYWVFNITPALLSQYKVVWKEISANGLECAVIKPLNGKPVIPDHKLMFIPCNSLDEAYYIAGVLNSTLVKAVVVSYAHELSQDTHILEFIRVPTFDPKNTIHLKIVELSKKAHDVDVERELDEAVAELYNISIKELEELRNLISNYNKLYT
ncbi:MAG: N-6 DNA methylase [Saccharolobus sp.]